MPETFVPLTTWLRPPSALPSPESVVSKDANEDVVRMSHDEVFARVRRLRAAVIEALECDAPERAALERIRFYADELCSE